MRVRFCSFFAARWWWQGDRPSSFFPQFLLSHVVIKKIPRRFVESTESSPATHIKRKVLHMLYAVCRESYIVKKVTRRSKMLVAERKSVSRRRKRSLMSLMPPEV